MIQKQDEEAREREEELIRCQNQLFEAFVQGFPFPQGGNRPGPVVEYVRHIDHLSRYAPDIVYMETRKNMSMVVGSGKKGSISNKSTLDSGKST